MHHDDLWRLRECPAFIGGGDLLDRGAVPLEQAVLNGEHVEPPSRVWKRRRPIVRKTQLKRQRDVSANVGGTCRTIPPLGGGFGRARHNSCAKSVKALN